MTAIYFARHAQADNTNHDRRNRPLTAKGMADRSLSMAYLADKPMDAVLSSPFRRAVDTVWDYADKRGFAIQNI